MAIVVKILRILCFFLVLLGILGIYFQQMTGARESYYPASSITGHIFQDNSSKSSEYGSVVYSSAALQLPDALLSPIPSFHFGFIEIFACFLFVIFTFCIIRKKKEISFFFINSYYHTLFLSGILINAP